MAVKWNRPWVASFGRRRMSFTRSDASSDSNECSTPVADKGHFVVYTSEGRRFMVPLPYIHSTIFNELLRMSPEEYGLRGDGPIMLPCDAVIMEYVLSLPRRRAPEAVEWVLLRSILEHQSSTCSSLPKKHEQQLVVCSF